MRRTMTAALLLCAWAAPAMADTFTDGGYSTTGGMSGLMPAPGPQPPGTTLAYETKCIGGHVQIIEIATTIYYTPAGTIPFNNGINQAQVVQSYLVTTHTINSDEKCPKPGTNPKLPPHNAAEAKDLFSQGVRQIADRMAEEKKKEKDETKHE